MATQGDVKARCTRHGLALGCVRAAPSGNAVKDFFGQKLGLPRIGFHEKSQIPRSYN